MAENTTEIIKKARQMLDTLTPISGDCGKQCNAACCHPLADDDPGGMCLYPGESALYDPLPSWAGIVCNVDGSKLITCGGTCERNNRPLACRIFPLLPAIANWDGESKPSWEQAIAVHDRRAYAVCPLANSRRLNPLFVRAVGDVALLLSKNPDTLAFMQSMYDRQSNAVSLLI